MLQLVADNNVDVLVAYLSHRSYSTTSTKDVQAATQLKALVPGNNMYGKCMNAAVRMLHRLALGISEAEPRYRGEKIWAKLKVLIGLFVLCLVIVFLLCNSCIAVFGYSSDRLIAQMTPILYWSPSEQDLDMLPDLARTYGKERESSMVDLNEEFPCFRFSLAGAAAAATAAATTAAATTAAAGAAAGGDKKSKASRTISEAACADDGPAAKRAKTPPKADAEPESEPEKSESDEDEADKDQGSFYHYECTRVAIRPLSQEVFHQRLGQISKKYELPGDVQPVTQAGTAVNTAAPPGLVTDNYGVARIHAKFARGRYPSSLKEYCASTEFFLTAEGLEDWLNDVRELIQEHGVDSYEHDEKDGPLDFYTLMSWFPKDQEGGAGTAGDN